MAEITSVDAMEEFIRTTSVDAFLMGLVDEIFKVMTFQPSKLSTHALHLLLLADKYELPSLSQRIRTHCTTKSRGASRYFNDAFAEASVRSAAKTWVGQPVLAMTSSI